MQVETLQLTPVKMTGMDRMDNVNKQEEKKSFAAYLEDAAKNVNGLLKNSERLDEELAAGKINDISQVVVAGEKAALAMQLTVQIRNRAVEAYQEMMRMQV